MNNDSIVAEAIGLKAINVTKVFDTPTGELIAVDDVSIDIPRGQFVSIIGPSGCGKSTLLRMFADLEQPTAGELLVNGTSAAQARANRQYAFVFQAPTLLPWKNVLKNVALPLKIKGVDKASRLETAREMIKLVGLEGFENQLPWQLSGGMQQRVSIARALTVRPPALLMDEPFGALDEITRDRMNLELAALRRFDAQTVLFITHSISEAVFLSDRVLVMSARPGKVIADIVIDLPEHRDAATRQETKFFEYVSDIRGYLVDAYNTTKP
jgi:NitT/TauT family transport system ATP-binding protein